MATRRRLAPSTSRACAGRDCRSDRQLAAIDRNVPVTSTGPQNVPHRFSIFFPQQGSHPHSKPHPVLPPGGGLEVERRAYVQPRLDAASTFTWRERNCMSTLRRPRRDVDVTSVRPSTVAASGNGHLPRHVHTYVSGRAAIRAQHAAHRTFRVHLSVLAASLTVIRLS